MVTLSAWGRVTFGGRRVRTLRIRATACALAVLALLLGGCTEDRVRPSDTLPPTSSPTPTATTEDLPGPPGYPFPPEALEYTEAGALAFFNYYIDLLNKTTETLDSEPIRLLSEPNCFGCERLTETYNADRDAGYRYEGGVTGLGAGTITPQLRPLTGGGQGAVVTAGGTQSPLTVLDTSGAPVPDRSYPEYQLIDQLVQGG